jgi:hypothetical protein
LEWKSTEGHAAPDEQAFGFDSNADALRAARAVGPVSRRRRESRGSLSASDDSGGVRADRLKGN